MLQKWTGELLHTCGLTKLQNGINTEFTELNEGNTTGSYPELLAELTVGMSFHHLQVHHWTTVRNPAKGLVAAINIVLPSLSVMFCWKSNTRSKDSWPNNGDQAQGCFGRWKFCKLPGSSVQSTLKQTFRPEICENHESFFCVCVLICHISISFSSDATNHSQEAIHRDQLTDNFHSFYDV